MINYSEADVERVAKLLHDARGKDVWRGNYTLARWILDRWPVEGSTPLDSPARAGMCGDRAPSFFDIPAEQPDRCVLPANHPGWHENDASPPMRWTADHDRLSHPAGEPVPVSPPVDPFEPMFGRITQADRDLVARTTGGGIRSVDVQPQYEDEAAPVSPPVDALEEILKLAERLAVHRSEAARDADRGRASAEQHHERAAAVRLLLAIRVEDVRAAGVEEGRRARDAEINAKVLASARETAAAFGPVPESVTVSYLTPDVRAVTLIEAYWKIRDHAAGLRDTTVYRKAAERHAEKGGRASERYLSLETRIRGIEDAAYDLAEMLGVEEHEIERPVDHG